MGLWLKRIRTRLKKLKTLNRENQRIGGKKTLLSLGLILWFFALSNYIKADAQFLPIPPSTTDLKVDDNKNNATENDHEPPIIQILTNKLIQGKNVLRVKISDQSGIKSCEIHYISHESIKTVDCVNDQNDVYKALISAAVPSETIQVYAKDPNGNSATGVKKLIVNPQLTIPDQISNMLSSLVHNLHLNYIAITIS
jgi:hypothetical protein